MPTRPRRTNARVTAAALFLLLGCLSFRDLIPMWNGVGWDGFYYAHWVQQLPLEVLFEPVHERPPVVRITSYSVSRVLEPIAIHYVLRALDVPPGRKAIIRAFTTANILLLTLAVYWLCRCGDLLGLGERAKWLVWLALLVNYVNAKMPLFYPVLTDSAAVAFGSGMLLLYLQRRTRWLMAATLAGGFVWPSLPYAGLLMIAFPARSAADRAREASLGPAPHRLDRVVAALAALGSVAIVAALALTNYEIRTTPVEPLRSWIPLSASLAAAYLYFGLRPLFDSAALWSDLTPARWVRQRSVWLAVLTFVAGALLKSQIPVSPDDMGFLRAVKDNFASSVTQPGIAWVAHALHYGPVVLFLLFLWRPISASVRRHGTGLVLCFALAVVLGAGSESRKLLNFYPLIVLFLAQAVAPLLTSRTRWIVLVAWSFVFSKLWLPMDEPLDLPFLREIPWQELYASSRGPWIDHVWWATQGAVVLAVGAWLFQWTRDESAGDPLH